ncbi:MAG: bifunctional heptose 7-phosphate kinase/heptose 1-phosphate adenyltransferase [Candidatus Dormibacteraeota bacterium]|nr:bifunctional heptose 7-phosphate kinase/heptose 1-phosphate adenyltransferase [Candidatus Dormibacteraeota bacterium]MBO0761540.1 bifunctional heptose 7-phosphate kinase/heptose 1-phosphate adenyltransferase [Candidatus Dormibacteraeota bacterium]
MNARRRTGRDPLVVIGDCLLDEDLEGRAERLASDAPVPVLAGPYTSRRPGGAGLAACLVARQGLPVRLITALCRDPAGEQLHALLEEAGVDVVDLGWEGTTPVKVRIRSAGQTLLRLDEGARQGRRTGSPSAEALASLASASAVVVSDYGYGITEQERVQGAIAAYARTGPVVWDPHPQGPAPVPGARLVKPNRREAGGGEDMAAVTRRARQLRRRWSAGAVVVTMGADGALLVEDDGPPLLAPAPRIGAHDSCGAGDSFSVTAAGAIARGATSQQAVTVAVEAAARFVAGGGAAAMGRDADDRTPQPSGDPDLDPALRAAAEIRARGGRLIATSGCFDLLHAGHVQMLEAARRLGDGLIVLLNSDRSVRELKGPGRPLLAARDRARVLSALGCVDAVSIFDEPTPVRALERLRPEVFAKGGDYRNRQLPEQEAISRWNGQVVVLPYLDGYSTTRLIQEVARNGSH